MAEEQPGTLAGQKLGVYQLLEKLGEGGMGAVYKARDLSLDRTVAVKTLPPALAADKVYVQRFVREARAVARLSHPNLVHIYHVGQREGLYYFAMEYIAGRSLHQLLRSGGPLTVEEFLRISGQVLAALDRVHSMGLVHRDVKSSNVLIEGGTGRAVLTDFGLAKGEAAKGAEGLTSAGTIMGTPEYMSPEQVEGRPADARSDLYSFGVMAFEMLAGRVPFTATSAIAVLRKHVEEPPPALASIRQGLPAGLDAVIARLLAKAPAERYGSAAELAGDLLKVGPTPELAELAAAGLPATARTIVGPQVALRGDRRSHTARTMPVVPAPTVPGRRGLLLAVAAAALLAVALGAAIGARGCRRHVKRPAGGAPVPVVTTPQPGMVVDLFPRGGGAPVRARILEIENSLATIEITVAPDKKEIRHVDLYGFSEFRLAPAPTPASPDKKP